MHSFFLARQKIHTKLTLMYFGFTVAIFSLIILSIGANIIRKILKSENVVLHALSFVPITCALMTISLPIMIIAFFIGVAHLKPFINSPRLLSSLFVLSLIAGSVLGIFLFIYILYKTAKRNLRKYIYTSYIACVFLCGLFGFATCLYFFFNAPWHSQEVDTYFSYESQALPAICSENNLRIKFKSGKIINLHMDTCGQCDYTLYKLGNDNIYMQARDGNQFSYLVDPSKEEVYCHSGNYLYKLKGDAICGFGGNEKVATFRTYKGTLSNKKGSFKSIGVEAGDFLDNKTLLGDLSIYYFDKH